MTLELAHQLALTKLVELLQTLTDPAEIRRVATAILRVKPPKHDVPQDVDEQETADAQPPQAPTTSAPVPPLSASDPSCLRASVPSSLSSDPSVPEELCDLTDDDLESVRQMFISRDTSRASEFRAMTPDQFRAHLRDIFSVLHTHAPPSRDDDDDN